MISLGANKLHREKKIKLNGNRVFHLSPFINTGVAAAVPRLFYRFPFRCGLSAAIIHSLHLFRFISPTSTFIWKSCGATPFRFDIFDWGIAETILCVRRK